MEWFSKDTIAAAAAMLAAFTSTLNLIQGLRTDRILVRYESVDDDSVGHKLLVQNLSLHDVHLYQVGFVRKDGRIISLTNLDTECRRGEHVGVTFWYGKTTLSTRELSWFAFEPYLDIVGGFAYCTTQKFYRVDLDKGNLTLAERIKIRLRLFWYCLGLSKRCAN